MGVLWPEGGGVRLAYATATVATLLGHSSPAITATYLAHLELRELREAVPPLPVLRSGLACST